MTTSVLESLNGFGSRAGNDQREALSSTCLKKNNMEQMCMYPASPISAWP